MMNFGEQQPDNSSADKKVYLGKRAFHVVAVNPPEEWMKEQKMYISEKEFERHGVMQTKNKPEGTVNRFAKVDVFIRDAFDDIESDILKISYMVQERYNVGNDGMKCQIINKYGSTLWVPVAEGKSLSISNPYIGSSPYVLDNIKLALVGEESLITFIRSLRNLNNVKAETTEDDRKKLTSIFGKPDLDSMFTGNFGPITKLLMHENKTTTIGFFLGARTSDKGSVYQDIYRDLPLRPYMVKTDKNEYLIKRVTADQAAGRYSNTYFDLNDLKYREYVTGDLTLPTASEDLFKEGPAANGSGFGAAANTPAPARQAEAASGFGGGFEMPSQEGQEIDPLTGKPYEDLMF